MTTDQEETPAAEAPAQASAKKRTKRASSKKTSDGTEAKKSVKAKGAASKKATAKPARKRTRRAEQPAPEAAEQVQDQVPAPVAPKPLPRLLQRFRDEIRPALIQEFSYGSPMQAPRLSKVILNIGLGEALQNPRAVESALKDLTLIAGQQPVTTRARRSIAGFKLREGMTIGLRATLRGRRMYEFVDRLISSALPRIRDFRGLSREAFDGHGNYSIGIREHVIFPEIDYNTIDRMRSLQVVIVTTAATDREGLRLLEMMGVPFTRPETEARVA